MVFFVDILLLGKFLLFYEVIWVLFVSKVSGFNFLDIGMGIFKFFKYGI